jgi:hypothetical protein
MSEFKPEIVRIRSVEPHPNADRLEVARVYDYPVVVGKGEFRGGDRAVYVPIDAVVRDDHPTWGFLGDKRRIRAKKLRGIYSQGLLAPPYCTCVVQHGTRLTRWMGSKLRLVHQSHCLLRMSPGSDVSTQVDLFKYEPPMTPQMRTENERDPGFMPIYTDIEGLRRHPDVLVEGEEVVLTEKIHGANGRWCFWQDRFWAASHRNVKRENPECLWWMVMDPLFREFLQSNEGIVFYGEVYGQVQDLRYGVNSGARVVLFDAYSIYEGRYLDYDDYDETVYGLMPQVPVLYRGPWKRELMDMAEGKTVLGREQHVREGFVVKPIRERLHDETGRVILKLVGQGYNLRKEK